MENCKLKDHSYSSSSISIAAKSLGKVDLSVLRLYFSRLNLALKVISQRAGGSVMSLNILNKGTISQPFLMEECCSLIKVYEPFCIPLFVG